MNSSSNKKVHVAVIGYLLDVVLADEISSLLYLAWRNQQHEWPRRPRAGDMELEAEAYGVLTLGIYLTLCTSPSKFSKWRK